MASGHPGVPVVPFARSKQVSGQRFTEDQAVCAAASRRLSSERAGPAAACVCLGMRWLERPDAWLLGFQLAHTSGFALPGKTVEASKQAGRQAESLAHLGTGSRAVPSPPKACMAMGLVVVKPLRCRKRLGTVSRS